MFKPKNKDFLSLAGVYTQIENKGTFTILTHDASSLFAKIHDKKNRQPFIFNDKQVKQQSDNHLDQMAIEILLKPQYDKNQIIYYSVSTDISGSKFNLGMEGIILNFGCRSCIFLKSNHFKRFFHIKNDLNYCIAVSYLI